MKKTCVHGASLHLLILKAAFPLKLTIFIMQRNDTKGKPKKSYTMLVTNITSITSYNKTRISSTVMPNDIE